MIRQQSRFLSDALSLAAESSKTEHDAVALICLSHLRWDFVYQRPHHLMTRFARRQRVYFVEEPVADADEAYLELAPRPGGVTLAIPHLPADIDPVGLVELQRELLEDLLDREEICHYVLWYYTPVALDFSRHLAPEAIVYDCMDELSAFALAPLKLRVAEQELFSRADLVFTGGHSLYEAKRRRHSSVHCFPSSVDVPHFAQARRQQSDRADQAPIPRPRIGFFGVIDERMDFDLVRRVAGLRPAWEWIFIGPDTKIDPDILPAGPNIHYLGARSYEDLPSYLSGWNAAILPFARNHSTRFISPTKTPEYLAAGLPVVSTSIHDVVHPYGDAELVRIADEPEAFVGALEAALGEDHSLQRERADEFLREMSWDRTWAQMNALIEPLLTGSRPEEGEMVEEEVGA